MEDTPVQTEAPATAAPDGTDAQSQPTFDVSQLTLAQTEALFRGESVDVPLKSGGEGKTTDQVEKTTPAAKVETPAGDTPPEVEPTAAEVEAEETPEEVDAEATAEPEAPADELTGIERPRLKDERDQLIAGVYMNAKRSGAPITWAEAEARVDGPKAEVKEAAKPVDYAGQITTLETEITAIEKQLDGFEEGLSTPEIRKLQRELSRKDGLLVLAKQNLESEAAAAETAEAAALAASDANRVKAHAQAIAEYPAVANDQSPLGKAVAKRVQELKNKNHPDHALLFSDSCPLIIARNVATEMGIQPVAKKKAAVSSPAKATVEAPPRKVVSPAPGNKTAVVPEKPAEDAKVQLERALHGDDVSLADLDAIQGMPDPNKLLVGALR